MDIIQSIQNSAEGWRMFFGGASDISAQKSEIGSALIGSGFSAAQERYVGIKAGGVSVVSAEARAPVGIRYIPTGVTVGTGGAVVDPATIDPGTPATVVATIQKSIAESAEGWRTGFATVAGKAKESIDRSIAGWGMLASDVGGRVSSTVGGATSGVGKWFGNLGEGASSLKWLLYIVVFVLIFVAIMTSIGYSGVGGPAARVAEREYVKRR